jgi:hypothetical protein
MKHCLIIGGTGILKEVSRQLAYEYDTVSVVARNSHKLYSLRRETMHLKGNLDPIQVDYTDYEKLRTEIELSIERYGSISLVVSWIHSTAPEASSVIANSITSQQEEFRFFDILGSASADPSKENLLPELAKLEYIKYRQIVLGFVLEEYRSRWLTDEEISSGVLKAIDEDTVRSVIGVTEPWDKRP